MLSFLQIGAIVAGKKVLDGSFKEWAADDDKFRKEHPRKEDKSSLGARIVYIVSWLIVIGLTIAWFQIVK